ncbi:MAG: CbiX/SirB N-terminal domain-containing protein [Acidobacteria bacterium]|nr:CbiX/SirB N-terminal domain-containing protein [Acidobacteriota bacterium]
MQNRCWILIGSLVMLFVMGLPPQVGISRAVGEKVAVILVGHGLAAEDFPREKLREFRRVMGQVMEAGGEEKAPAELVARLHALEREMRQWKRTPENDPYDAAVKELAERIKQIGGYDMVEVAHNEACGLDVDEAIDSAIKKGAARVVVLTTMVIKGGTHAEDDIARKVEKAKRSHPQVNITYAWPFDTDQLARLFVEQVNRSQL